MGKDAAFCFVCCKAIRVRKATLSSTAEKSFLSAGFTNWKDASRGFKKHEEYDFHRLYASALASIMDVGNML